MLLRIMCFAEFFRQSEVREVDKVKIVVLLKQVPGTASVGIDPEKGTLKREGVISQTNPYDLHALEAALKIKEQLDGQVCVLSMGPPQAEAAIRESFWMGADEGYLLTDRLFAGADTLATSFTLSQCAKMIGFDLIVAGMQSTDGDTAQVGPGVAEFLDIPHISYVKYIFRVDENRITVGADMGHGVLTQEMDLPCLITVSRDLNQPRLPSFKKKKETKNREIRIIKASDLPQCDETYYGLSGSPTRVEKIFPPVREQVKETWKGSPGQLAQRLYSLFKEMRIL